MAIRKSLLKGWSGSAGSLKLSRLPIENGRVADTTSRDAANLTIEDAAIASRETAAMLESVAELLAYLVDRRESDELSEVEELWSLPDGDRMNAFQFEGPDSFHQLANEFDRVAQAIEDVEIKD